jgi:hypothetical protein
MDQQLGRKPSALRLPHLHIISKDVIRCLDHISSAPNPQNQSDHSNLSGKSARVVPNFWPIPTPIYCLERLLKTWTRDQCQTHHIIPPTRACSKGHQVGLTLYAPLHIGRPSPREFEHICICWTNCGPSGDLSSPCLRLWGMAGDPKGQWHLALVTAQKLLFCGKTNEWPTNGPKHTIYAQYIYYQKKLGSNFPSYGWFLLNEVWCETLHHITIHSWRAVWYFTSHNYTFMKGGVKFYIA